MIKKQENYTYLNERVIYINNKKVNELKRKERVGEIVYNSYGSKMILIEYNDIHDVTVQFENGYLIKTRYSVFKKGAIKSPYDKTVYGVGYLGEGKYAVCHDYREKFKNYVIWQHILERCYDPNYSKKKPTYEYCAVCDEWHNFQIFSDWYWENYYEIDDQLMCVDKDILIKGNKLYSPETCLIVPKSINNGFVTINKNSGLPKGVKKQGNKYVANCKTFNAKKHLGTFETPEEAFEAYKKYKETSIKELADWYKNKYPQFPQKVYDALYNYKIEITD